jgi:hypothetical protein
MTQPTERSARPARPARPAGDATKDAKRDFAVATNRKALHDYFVESTIEAGLAL